MQKGIVDLHQPILVGSRRIQQGRFPGLRLMSLTVAGPRWTFTSFPFTSSNPLLEHLVVLCLAYYIFSGAETPNNFSAFSIVWRVAEISARRACDKSFASGSNTLLAL